MTDPSTFNGPLHSDITPHLDQEYAAFHKKYLADRPAIHKIPWDPACRVGPINLGGLNPCKVGSVRDLTIPGTPPVNVRVFTPPGDRPTSGWPVLAYFHGGGWVLGNIDTENSFSARTCLTAKCVVVSVDYRLAPEHVFPAAVDDSWTALEWIYEHGAADLGINPSKIAVGGSSAGGNLSAVMTQRAVQRSPPLPIQYQVLIVPVTDNTVQEDGSSLLPTYHESWIKWKNTTPLTPEKMLWFRSHYLPDKSKWTHVEASPLFQKDNQKLKEAGRNVELVVYPGAPHSIMAMDEAIKIGFQLVWTRTYGFIRYNPPNSVPTGPPTLFKNSGSLKFYGNLIHLLGPHRNLFMASIPSVSQAWRFPVDQSSWKGHQSLQLREVKLSPPQKGEVLVKLYAAALNYRIDTLRQDILISNGTYPASPTDSTGPDGQGLIPTSDGAGEVVAVGEGVTQWNKGDRVHSLFFETWLDGPILPEHNFQALGAGTPGCLSQYRIFKAETLLPIPPRLSYEEAATIPCAALTAWNSFFERKPITDKSTVLVLGSGGVSVFGAQLAKAAGARVIATTSSQEKIEKYKALGVDEILNYREFPEWSAKVKELTGGKGVEQVLEVGGEGTVFQSIKSIERGGLIHIIGAVATDTPSGGTVQELGTLISITPVTLSGVQIGSKAMCERLDAFITQRKIKPVIDRVFGWNDVHEAFNYQLTGSHFGKVVVKID
ncbi:hypothetical protein OPQ81_010356 [Rhizoctonia solani]|nr:hypothetical protein OPQ81_010356 [Rhizoctonia solani]